MNYISPDSVEFLKHIFITYYIILFSSDDGTNIGTT